MQKIYLDSFIQEIENIRKYIKHINIINEFGKEKKYIRSENLINFHQHLHDFGKEKKLFEYKAIIISIYGVLENTISEWIQIHIENISNIVNSYSNLEDNSKINHFNLSIQLISRISENRHSKFNTINKEDILRKLNNSIINPNDFNLNKEAYIPLSGNIKHSNIKESFKPLNIDLDFLKDTLHDEINNIDELVRLRNQIAHGVEIDEILALTEFEIFIKALQTYMTKIFKIIDEKEVEYEFKYQSKIYIDKPKEFYQNNTVCIINIKDIEIKVGDTLFIEKTNKVLIATVLNIEKDDISVESANNGELGLLLNIPIQKNSKIWKKII